jgi:glycerol-3-phosphate acyltransferase PlsY
MQNVIAIVSGYVLGSIPFAFLLTRSRGVDLRAVGSRNLGAANVLRTSGVPLGVAVLALDAAKGAASILIARLLSDNLAVAVTSGVAAIIGHIYPVWLRFRGGKGVATAAGVFGMLAPVPTALAAVVFVSTIVVTRFVSAGSMAGALALVVATAAGHVPGPVVAGAIGSAMLVFYRHRDNLSRLVAGTERRIGLRL